MAKALMIQGTGSGAGKSLIAAAFCRIFSDMGINVAPFKAQNMALNSYITGEGGEIGRAQALQAEAARVPASVDMNPILLKVSGETGSQVIVHGKVLETMRAQEYYAFRQEAWKAVAASYKRLAQRHDLLVIEGAGSPAEINLMNVDIVNMAVAKHAKAPVLLVGDIDKGGVFASLYGTIKLLGRDSRHIKAFIINKFRGDLAILKPGLDMIRDKTGKPVIGVLPYIFNIGLPEEDGLSLQKNAKAGLPNRNGSGSGKVRIVVARLKYIANFTDFDPLALEPDVELIYSDNPADIEGADLVIVPGSKNTMKDLAALKELGLDESIKKAYEKGIQLIGICGGYQMLGRKIHDPYCVESSCKAAEGLGLLNIETTFERTKTTCRAEAAINTSGAASGCTGRALLSRYGVPPSLLLKGYEIHMGGSKGDIGLFTLKRAFESEPVMDGSENKNCWGTYLHGIFENDQLRRGIINSIRARKGMSPLGQTYSYAETKEQAIDSLAKIVRENLDMDFIKGAIRL